MSSWLSTLDNISIHVSFHVLTFQLVLLIILILSFKRDLSVLLIILMAFGVLRLDLSFRLTGMILLSRHLSENLQ